MMTEKRNSYWIAWLMMAAVTGTLCMMFFAPPRGVPMMMHYTCPIVFAFVGMNMSGRKKSWAADVRLGAAFMGWYVLSRILLKDLYLRDYYELFGSLCCAYLFALPFAGAVNDHEKKAGLKIAAALLMLAGGVAAYTGIAAAVLDTPIVLPVLGTEIEMNPYDLRLYVGSHPNFSACLFAAALLVSIWMLVDTKRRWVAIPCVLIAAGTYLGIALTDSRTTMLQFSCFAAGILFVAMLRLPIKSMRKKALIGAAAGAACLLVAYAGFGLAKTLITDFANSITALAETAEKKVVAERSLLADLRTMTGRTGIFANIINLIRNQPDILLTGMLNSTMDSVVMEVTGVYHAHNAYLQTLLNMGLVGLVIALVLTVRTIWLSVKVIFSRKAAFGDQVLAVMLLSFLVTTIPEPYLFSNYLYITNFLYLLIYGYVLEAARALRE